MNIYIYTHVDIYHISYIKSILLSSDMNKFKYHCLYFSSISLYKSNIIEYLCDKIKVELSAHT